MTSGETPPRGSAVDLPEPPAPEKNRQYVYLGVKGSFEPEEITAFLGLEPTKTRRRSEGRTPKSREFAIWNFQIPAMDDAPIEEQLRVLLSELLNKAELLGELDEKHAASIQIVGDFGPEGYPGLFFDAEIVKGLGRLGLPIDFDLYGWKEPETEIWISAEKPA